MILITILKVLGHILLIAVLFLLFCVLYLLVCPVTYEFYASYGDTPGLIRCSVKGFLHFLQFEASYSEQKLQWGVDIFWGRLRLFPGRRLRPGKEKREAENAKEELQLDASDVAHEAAEDLSRPMATSTSAKPHHKKNSQKRTKKKQKDTKKPQKRTPGERIRGLLKNLNNPDFREAVAFLKKKSVWIFLKICPKSLSCDVSFSLGDPSLTGQFTGLLALCPASYGKKVRIIPDFSEEDPFFRGWIQCRGHVFLAHVLWFVTSIFLHENCRKLFHIS